MAELKGTFYPKYFHCGTILSTAYMYGIINNIAKIGEPPPKYIQAENKIQPTPSKITNIFFFLIKNNTVLTVINTLTTANRKNIILLLTAMTSKYTIRLTTCDEPIAKAIIVLTIIKILVNLSILNLFNAAPHL
jgi:hypothetical protein